MHLLHVFEKGHDFNPCEAEPRYALPLETVKIQISLKKPTDLDLHYLCSV